MHAASQDSVVPLTNGSDQVVNLPRLGSLGTVLGKLSQLVDQSSVLGHFPYESFPDLGTVSNRFGFAPTNDSFCLFASNGKGSQPTVTPSAATFSNWGKLEFVKAPSPPPVPSPKPHYGYSEPPTHSYSAPPAPKYGYYSSYGYKSSSHGRKLQEASYGTYGTYTTDGAYYPGPGKPSYAGQSPTVANASSCQHFKKQIDGTRASIDLRHRKGKVLVQ